MMTSSFEIQDGGSKPEVVIFAVLMMPIDFGQWLVGAEKIL